MDRGNFNPQNRNAQNILCRLIGDELAVTAFCYGEPRADVEQVPAVEIKRLFRTRLWKLSGWLAYQADFDVFFYPGAEMQDDWGWRFRDFVGRGVPIVATLEGLAGDSERELEYSRWAGHPVYCQVVSGAQLARIDRLYRRAEHIVAISPFLAEMGRRRYGDKFSVIQLGVEDSIFFGGTKVNNVKPKVVSAGTFQCRKRPELFIELAKRYSQADFTWYGSGDSERLGLMERAKAMGIGNVSFPGGLPPQQLAKAFRDADLFVMPSQAEGVPKVTQEAAACGLPVVLFGYYEAPSVVDGENGYVVWNDKDFVQRVGELIGSGELRQKFGAAGTKMAKEWSWNRIAAQWELALLGECRKHLRRA
jgi:glycosyltransferase involved in cell wall biosynthesis